ncbi:hypothetical protein [Microviridae sp.]|nr:hypothetical protein [Microviridae sp.]
MALGPKGEELLDPRPMEAPVGFSKPLTLQEQIARVLKTEKLMEEHGMENYDEANDFDIEDDFHNEERLSGYEIAEEEYPVMAEETPVETPIRSGAEPDQTEPEPVASEPQIPEVDTTGDPVLNN